jgi:hypothetical protein
VIGKAQGRVGSNMYALPRRRKPSNWLLVLKDQLALLCSQKIIHWMPERCRKSIMCLRTTSDTTKSHVSLKSILGALHFNVEIIYLCRMSKYQTIPTMSISPYPSRQTPQGIGAPCRGEGISKDRLGLVPILRS